MNSDSDNFQDYLIDSDLGIRLHQNPAEYFKLMTEIKKISVARYMCQEATYDVW